MPAPERPAVAGRWVAWSLTLIAASVLAVILPTTATAGPGSGPPAPAEPWPGQPVAMAQPTVTDTAHGPLGPADRELLIRVRLAGLWEIPAGLAASEKGTTEEIREIGHHIHEEHIELDAQAVAVAEELGVPLPDQPHADHQVWLDMMDGMSGEEFDRFFIQVLREAHGEIYPIIADVRVGTRNDLVRDFAEVGEEFVGRHLTYLESSGLVEWAELPPPSEPGGTQSRFLAASPAGVHPVLIWALLFIAAVAGAVTFVRTLRPR